MMLLLMRYFTALYDTQPVNSKHWKHILHFFISLLLVVVVLSSSL